MTSPLSPFEDLVTREWPRRGDGVFLNAAAQGLLPARAIAAMADFEGRRAWPNAVDDDDLLAVETEARARLAALVGAPVARIGLATNTSDGLHVAALHLPLAPGDRVLVPRGEFPANVLPWLALARNGVETVFLDLAGPHLDPDDVTAALDRDPRIRAVALALVQFSTGHRHPVEAVGRACRARGVAVVVDAIQGIGGIPFAWDDDAFDLVACGGQKWMCGPWGSGFFVAGDRLLAAEPVRAGWLQVTGARDGEYAALTDYRLDFPADASRFEVGTYAYGALVGLAESAALLSAIGPARIHAHVRALADPIEAWLLDRGGATLACRDDACRSNVLCVRAGDPAATRALHRRLAAAGIACAYREGSIRIAPHVYNTPADVDRTLAALEASWPVAAVLAGGAA